MALIKSIQVDLHLTKNTHAVIIRRFNKENGDVGLIQEPWVNNARVELLFTSL